MPDIQKIHSENAPAPVGPYSQATKAGDTVYFCGQIGLDPATGALVEGGAGAQARQVFANMQAIAEASGTDLAHFTKVTIFFTDMAGDGAAVNEAYTEYFSEPFPARSGCEVSKLPLGAAVEVEAIAVLPG